MASPRGTAALLSDSNNAEVLEAAYATAERRLEDGRDRLRSVGAHVSGEVGDPDPLVAVKAVLAHREVDEIIVSTLPPGLSHWLRMDVPRRLQHRFHKPVTTVTARRRAAAGAR